MEWKRNPGGCIVYTELSPCQSIARFILTFMALNRSILFPSSSYALFIKLFYSTYKLHKYYYNVRFTRQQFNTFNVYYWIILLKYFCFQDSFVRSFFTILNVIPSQSDVSPATPYICGESVFFVGFFYVCQVTFYVSWTGESEWVHLLGKYYMQMRKGKDFGLVIGLHKNRDVNFLCCMFSIVIPDTEVFLCHFFNFLEFCGFCDDFIKVF